MALSLALGLTVNHYSNQGNIKTDFGNLVAAIRNRSAGPIQSQPIPVVHSSVSTSVENDNNKISQSNSLRG